MEKRIPEIISPPLELPSRTLKYYYSNQQSTPSPSKIDNQPHTVAARLKQCLLPLGNNDASSPLKKEITPKNLEDISKNSEVISQDIRNQYKKHTFNFKDNLFGSFDAQKQVQKRPNQTNKNLFSARKSTTNTNTITNTTNPALEIDRPILIQDRITINQDECCKVEEKRPIRVMNMNPKSFNIQLIDNSSDRDNENTEKEDRISHFQLSSQQEKNSSETSKVKVAKLNFLDELDPDNKYKKMVEKVMRESPLHLLNNSGLSSGKNKNRKTGNVSVELQSKPKRLILLKRQQSELKRGNKTVNNVEKRTENAENAEGIVVTKSPPKNCKQFSVGSSPRPFNIFRSVQVKRKETEGEEETKTPSNPVLVCSKPEIKWMGDSWPDVFKQIAFEKLIGQGTFAKVYVARDKTLPRETANSRVAVKVVDKSKIIELGCRRFLDQELEIISSLDHENICKFIRLIEDKKRVRISLW